VLAQSSPYIADVAPAPSVSRKSFAARMSVSEVFTGRDSLQEGGAGGTSNNMIIANHCAWFIVDKKKSSSSKSAESSGSSSMSSASSQQGGAQSKDNSVVRLLSSENVRMDIDETQLRVGIKMIKNGV
jgi:hypothetical protein